jgi:transcriptional regulator with XRE-family HTH domain
MSYGEWIRRERKRRKLTQRQLGEQIGATDSYVSHLEKELKIPSADFTLILANFFGFAAEEQQNFLRVVDEARIERSRQRIERRAQAVNSGPSENGRGARVAVSGDSESPLEDLAQITRRLESDPELAAAYRDLVAACSDPGLRKAALTILRSLAQTANE